MTATSRTVGGRHLGALPFVLLTGLCFGSGLIAARFALAQFAPSTFTGLRLVLASLGFLGIYLFDRTRHPWPATPVLWLHGTVLGIFGVGLPMFMTIVALQHLSSGVTAIFASVGPAITVMLAHFSLADERLTVRKVLGVALALGGALLLALRGENGLSPTDNTAPLYYGLLLLVMLSVSISTIYARKYVRSFKSFDVAGFQLFIAAALVMPLSLAGTGLDLSRVDWWGASALLYTSLMGTFVALLLYYDSVQRFGATAAAMTQYVVPIVAGVGGVLLLGEQFTLVMVAGIGVILAGITLLRL